MRFACLPGCTACCSEPGFVYLTEDDLVRAAAHLGMAPAEFETRYVYHTRHLLRLRKPRGIGRVISSEQMRRAADQMWAAYPTMY